MPLVIAEKPAVALAISSAIPGIEQKNDGYIQKGGYTITWAKGHLLDLKEPETHGKEKGVKIICTPNESL